MKDFFKTLIILIVIIAVIVVGSLFYHKYISKMHTDISRENFEHNKSHVHSMIKDLAKYKLELAKTTDEVERQAIINYIQETYSTFDSKLIENFQLKQFFIKVMEGDI